MQCFTPGPDGGGLYSVLVHVGGKATSYHVFVRPAEPNDVGPGLALRNGERRSDSASRADPLDLYRLDIVARSDMRVTVAAATDLGVKAVNGTGPTPQTGD